MSFFDWIGRWANARTGKGLALAAGLIVAWEGYDPIVKHFSIDPPGVLTVCNGITNYDRPDLKVGQFYSKPACQQMLAEALPKYDKQLLSIIKAQMPPHRHAAMLSFIYNVVPANLKKSTVAKELNAGNVQRGCDALRQWNKANGKVLKGLVNRREAERVWCLRND